MRFGSTVCGRYCGKLEHVIGRIGDRNFFRGRTRRFRDMFSGRFSPPVAVILLYHRVAEVNLDPFRLCVPPERYEQQLRLVRARYQVTTLDEFVEAFPQTTNGQGTVIVTFDDGYADNLEAAYPIMAAIGLPLTVFITARPILDAQTFWWDDLTSAVVAAENVARGVTVELEKGRRSFSIQTDADRLHACLELHRLLRSLPESARRSALRQLSEQGDGNNDGRASLVGRPLTAEELRCLDSLPGVTIGAHTVTHPQLSSLTADEQAVEINDCRMLLEDLLGHPIDLFSYPYGRPYDIPATARNMVAAAGYRAAVTTVQRAVTRRTPIHALSRLTVYNWSADELLARLRTLFHDA